MYRPTFVDKVKSSGEKRSRLCVAACNDHEHGLFTAAPTIKRFSLRVLFANAVIFKFRMLTRDITKAFAMSKTLLRRPIYLRPPKEMGLPKNIILKVIKPLYGMPESPIHWYKTFIDHHCHSMQMEQLPIDPCLLVSTTATSLECILGIQVDDTLFAGSDAFIEKEESVSKEFPSRGRVEIQEDPIPFNGIEVSKMSGCIIITQKKMIQECPRVGMRENLNFAEFRSLRAKLAYIAFSTAPDVLVFVAKLAQITEKQYATDSSEGMKILRKTLKKMSESPSSDGIKYVPLTCVQGRSCCLH